MKHLSQDIRDYHKGLFFKWKGSESVPSLCFIDPGPHRSCGETEPAARSLIDHSATSQQPSELTYSFQLAFSWPQTDGGRTELNGGDGGGGRRDAF